MFPAGNKAKRLSLVNHGTKTIHHLIIISSSSSSHNKIWDFFFFNIRNFFRVGSFLCFSSLGLQSSIPKYVFFRKMKEIFHSVFCFQACDWKVCQVASIFNTVSVFLQSLCSTFQLHF